MFVFAPAKSIRIMFHMSLQYIKIIFLMSLQYAYRVCLLLSLHYPYGLCFSYLYNIHMDYVCHISAISTHIVSYCLYNVYKDHVPLQFPHKLCFSLTPQYPYRLFFISLQYHPYKLSQCLYNIHTDYVSHVPTYHSYRLCL